MKCKRLMDRRLIKHIAGFITQLIRVDINRWLCVVKQKCHNQFNWISIFAKPKRVNILVSSSATITPGRTLIMCN